MLWPTSYSNAVLQVVLTIPYWEATSKSHWPTLGLHGPQNGSQKLPETSPSQIRSCACKPNFTSMSQSEVCHFQDQWNRFWTLNDLEEAWKKKEIWLHYQKYCVRLSAHGPPPHICESGYNRFTTHQTVTHQWVIVWEMLGSTIGFGPPWAVPHSFCYDKVQYCWLIDWVNEWVTYAI